MTTRRSDSEPQQARGSWRVMLDHSPDPFVVVDVHGRIQDTNRAFDALHDRAGRPSSMQELVTEQQRSSFEAALGHVMTGAAHRRLDLPIRQSNGVMWCDTVLFHGEPGTDGRPRTCIMLRDVTQRRLEERRLRRSENLMIDTHGTAHLGTWEWDITKPNASWSDQLHHIYGTDPATHQPSYEDYLTRIHPDDVERVKKVTERAFHEHVPYAHDERIHHTSGEMRHLHTWAHPVLDENGKLTALVGVCQDITDRKRAEEAVEKQLHEKEVLLKEIHHRVKNNLQIMVSLLRLQSRKLVDEQAREAILDSSSRVQSMALVHEHLYGSADLAQLDLSDHLHRLISELMHAYGSADRQITANIELQAVKIGIDDAVSIGLLVNELVSNALKHAFVDAQNGHLEISLKARGDDLWLTVRDDGKGLPVDAENATSETLGMILVHTFTERLHATLDIERQGGTTIRLRIPWREAPKEE